MSPTLGNECGTLKKLFASSFMACIPNRKQNKKGYFLRLTHPAMGQFKVKFERKYDVRSQ